MRCAFAATLLLIAVSCGCSSPSRTETAAAPPKVVEPPADQSAHMPADGLLDMKLVPDHLLNQPFMPGGNLASYRTGKLAYGEFLAKLPDAESAAIVLIDWKKALASPKYLAHMGGYYGMLGAQPVYIFNKGTWIAGVTGLSEVKADPLARVLAAKLR